MNYFLIHLYIFVTDVLIIIWKQIYCVFGLSCSRVEFFIAFSFLQFRQFSYFPYYKTKSIQYLDHVYIIGKLLHLGWFIEFGEFPLEKRSLNTYARIRDKFLGEFVKKGGFFFFSTLNYELGNVEITLMIVYIPVIFYLMFEMLFLLICWIFLYENRMFHFIPTLVATFPFF